MAKLLELEIQTITMIVSIDTRQLRGLSGSTVKTYATTALNYDQGMLIDLHCNVKSQLLHKRGIIRQEVSTSAPSERGCFIAAAHCAHGVRPCYENWSRRLSSTNLQHLFDMNVK